MDHLKGNDMSNSKECIKANPTLQRIPIIAVTSYALSGEDALARAAGCDDVVAKPYSPRHLLPRFVLFCPSHLALALSINLKVLDGSRGEL
jgi:CheY-like chemotaxis protein